MASISANLDFQRLTIKMLFEKTGERGRWKMSVLEWLTITWPGKKYQLMGMKHQRSIRGGKKGSFPLKNGVQGQYAWWCTAAFPCIQVVETYQKVGEVRIQLKPAIFPINWRQEECLTLYVIKHHSFDYREIVLSE